jgi:hypothetical protein
MSEFSVPACIRGVLHEKNCVPFGGGSGEARFRSPDPVSLLSALPLREPGALRDLYSLSFDEITHYLVNLGKRLDLSSNQFLQEALERTYDIADQTPSLLRWQYQQLPAIFTREAIVETAEVPIGIRYLESWVPTRMTDGKIAAVKALGARAIHIIAGNSPALSAVTVLRNAITRSDAIIKAPSNDPLTALAIARTMIDMAPDHPLTRHLSVAYWKGGSTEFEEQLYRPEFIEKIVAWGGLASVKHVARYIQPGIELITLDPKRSATVVGREVFSSEQTMQDVALRIAADVGAWNQLACCAARVVFVESGTDEEGLARLKRLAERTYAEMVDLPADISTRPKRFDPDLRSQLRALRFGNDFYDVIGGEEDEGAMIVSKTPEPVDFHPTLSGRTANFVPLETITDAFAYMSAYTQTIGIYPEKLKEELRDVLPLYGAQRLVTLGYANAGNSAALPQDAMEPVRRMVRWIVDETCTVDDVRPLWVGKGSVSA